MFNTQNIGIEDFPRKDSTVNWDWPSENAVLKLYEIYWFCLFSWSILIDLDQRVWSWVHMSHLFYHFNKSKNSDSHGHICVNRCSSCNISSFTWEYCRQIRKCISQFCWLWSGSYESCCHLPIFPQFCAAGSPDTRNFSENFWKTCHQLGENSCSGPCLRILKGWPVWCLLCHYGCWRSQLQKNIVIHAGVPAPSNVQGLKNRAESKMTWLTSTSHILFLIEVILLTLCGQENLSHKITQP